MELKTARLTLLIDPNKKAAFERLCTIQDLTPSQVVRQLIRDYLALHEVSYVPSGRHADRTAKAQRVSSRSRRTPPASEVKSRRRV
jgi:hypothetical protein